MIIMRLVLMMARTFQKQKVEAQRLFYCGSWQSSHSASNGGTHWCPIWLAVILSVMQYGWVYAQIKSEVQGSLCEHIN